jgi:hypothetical protein
MHLCYYSHTSCDSDPHVLRILLTQRAGERRQCKKKYENFSQKVLKILFKKGKKFCSKKVRNFVKKSHLTRTDFVIGTLQKTPAAK